KKFEEILAWQEARVLVNEIYSITKLEGFARDYGLKDQIRRAAVSTMSNIFEGFSRRSDKDFARFLDIASASSSEVCSLLYIALDEAYIAQAKFDLLYKQCFKVGAMIHSFARYLRNS
ncbi:MAG: four helix bundle protein, partial [Bacteroidota bacterium]|nr:four helix bundle protein [Bacteroidota bacterium]